MRDDYNVDWRPDLAFGAAIVFLLVSAGTVGTFHWLAVLIAVLIVAVGLAFGIVLSVFKAVWCACVYVIAGTFFEAQKFFQRQDL